MQPKNVRFKLRRDTAHSWTTVNPMLKEGEPGFESDTGRFKIGDGITPWTTLPYFEPGSASPADSYAIQQAINAHVNSDLPHPVYDDGPSFLLLYENAKV